MPLDTRIALGVQPLQVPDPLAQYGQVQNILAAQTQRQTGQLHAQQLQFQMDQAKEAQDAIGQIMGAVQEHGGPSDPMVAAMQMLQHRNPTVQATGRHLMDSAQILRAYQSDKAFAERGRQPPSAAPSVAAGPSAPIDETMKADWIRNAPAGIPYEQYAASQTTGATAPVAPPTQVVQARPLQAPGVALPPVSNQLAPAPVAPVNQLATPVSKVDQIDAEIADLMRPEYMYSPQAKARIEFLTKRRDQLSKAHVVGRNLVTEEGNVTYTAPHDIAPSELQKYINERNALAAKNPQDPNIALYDRQIKDMGLARERLNFDQQKFAWEKANPGYTIQQAEDGSIVGVNNRTLQAFPVTLNASAPPPTAPFTGAAPAVAPVPSAAVAPSGVNKTVPAAITQPIIQPRGEPLKGKSAGLTESQGNATAFGMRMKDSHGLLKDLENKGETGTGVIRGTVGGVVGLVPLIGDKLTAGTDNIFTVLPSILGGMSSEQQQIQNARINFITAVLRKESGAAISPGEFITAEKLYFPQPGNDPSVIKQKQKARELAIKAMEIQAGPGAKSIQSLTPADTSGATSASDPLGLFPAKK
jgi:hypothetical protein